MSEVAIEAAPAHIARSEVHAVGAVRITSAKRKRPIVALTMLVLSATTGRVRLALAIRTAPTTCTSVRATWTGTAAVATTGGLSALFACRIYSLCVTRFFSSCRAGCTR